MADCMSAACRGQKKGMLADARVPAVARRAVREGRGRGGREGRDGQAADGADEARDRLGARRLEPAGVMLRRHHAPKYGNDIFF